MYSLTVALLQTFFPGEHFKYHASARQQRCAYIKQELIAADARDGFQRHAAQHGANALAHVAKEVIGAGRDAAAVPADVIDAARLQGRLRGALANGPQHGGNDYVEPFQLF